MEKFVAKIAWTLKPGEDFAKGRYSRLHTLSFDGGIEVPGSASPHIVGKWGVAEAVDPEELLVAALSNCHMLTVLHKARLAGLVATAYEDNAEGIMEEIAPGRMAVTGKRSRKWRTALAMVLTWPGVPVTAWASMRPSRS